ncbi:hypothetical protein BDP27DRAFT_1420154 [Rhodocollybia butyracea]|uniref:Uncharacterized protein n=1 Tax=Rhodocollybia butyracea TaxID=206335 RepID=A0A9P5PQF7_9AGAR|nr:hypothetical protein BDP27DRAFT_1420154 [Rhodocollybia butyracea]
MSDYVLDMDLINNPDHVSTPGAMSNYISGMDFDPNELIKYDNGHKSEGSTYKDNKLAGENSDSGFDYEAAMEELKKACREAKTQKTKNKKGKTSPEQKKAQKCAVCDAVSRAQTIQPNESIDVVKTNKKRPSTNAEASNMQNQAYKVSKSKISLSNSGTLTKAGTETNDKELTELEEPKGEFDEDESPTVTAATFRKPLPCVGQLAGVSLMPANMSKIYGKECHGTGLVQPASVKCQTITKANLPISSAADLCKWETDYMPHIYDFVGAEEYQFGLSNNVELKYLIKNHWVTVYPLLKEYKDHLAIGPLVHSQICTYRSEFGKKALKLVGQTLNDQLCSVEDCADFVANQLEEEAWAYSSPGLMRETSAGAMRGPFILATFAHHCKITKMFKAKSDFGFPCGALAVSAAAVLRALKAKEEEQKKDGCGWVSKNTKDSFGEAPWADYCGKYFKMICKASDKKWMAIFDVTKEHINTRKLVKQVAEKMVADEGEDVAEQRETLVLVLSN